MRQPSTLYQLAFQKWRFAILEADSMSQLVHLVSRAPPKLLKEHRKLVSLSFIHIGLKLKNFPSNGKDGFSVAEFYDCIGQFVLNSDRESRAELHKYFPLLVEKEYCPFEGEPPLVRIVLETLLWMYFTIHPNVGILKTVPGWELLIRDPAV
jgi:hypothetical protein